MRITQKHLRQIIRQEAGRLSEARKKGGSDSCLYILYDGRVAYYYIAQCGLSEDEALEKGQDVTGELAGDQGSADPLSLYDWLQNHDDVGHVYDYESVGGEVSKEEFMEQLRGVGEEEGLFADEDDVNEGDEPLDETEDQHYNDDLQSRLGRFTSPENVKGTPEYAAKHRQPSAPRHSQEPSRGTVFGGGYDYSEYDHLMREGGPGDDFLDYDPEEIPDMDDQYDPEYYEGLDDEDEDADWEPGDDGDWSDLPAGEIMNRMHDRGDFDHPDDADIGVGSRDVALRQGRGHRTDEGHDHDMDDYEHAYAMGGGSDEEGFAIDYDTGRPSPFAAKMFGQPAAGADDIEGADADEDVFGDDDMGRRGAMDDYRHAYKLGGGRDEEGFAADYDTGKKRQFPPSRGGISEARWAKLAGILKG